MKYRILVVAEDAPVRATLTRWLMAAGYAVELAESPKRAREVIENEAVALGILAPQRFGAAGRICGMPILRYRFAPRAQSVPSSGR